MCPMPMESADSFAGAASPATLMKTRIFLFVEGTTAPQRQGPSERYAKEGPGQFHCDCDWMLCQ